MKILTGKQQRPRRVLLYGRHGIGKSTWAAQAPKPLFVNLEDGIADIDCDQTPLIGSFSEFMDALVYCSEEDKDHETIVIDSADWLDRLIQTRIAEDANVTTVSEIPYGKGFDLCLAKWQVAIGWLGQIREHGKMVILLSHSQVAKHSPPGGDSYDRWEPAIDRRSSRLLQEWCDEVLFATTRTLTRTEDLGFDRTRNIPVASDERILVTRENNEAVAKNRLALPSELPFSFESFNTAVRSNIDGVVKGGSSKKKPLPR